MGHPNRQFKGDFQRWANQLTAYGLEQLVKSRSQAPFITTHATGEPVLIVPTVAPDKIEIAVFYAPLRKLSARHLVKTSIDDICKEWKLHARAYVRALVDPKTRPFVKCLDHNGTRNATKEIEESAYCRMPSLSELDAALNTTLELHEVDVITIARKMTNEVREF